MPIQNPSFVSVIKTSPYSVVFRVIFLDYHWAFFIFYGFSIKLPFTDFFDYFK